jgi:AraC-like DNA-binding protein
MAMVLQGTKSVEFGQKHLEYGAGRYIVASMDLPATSRIVNASKTHPLLAVAVDIDFAELKEVIQRCDVLPPSSSQSGMTVFEADAELLESVVRLLRLMDTPQHARPLAPLVRQEILYRLLSGASGSRLLEVCRNGSPSNRIADATVWIQNHFAEGFMVGELAHHVAMSPSSFHQHFKAITGMTPIQYQRRIRLQEARKSLLFDSIDIGEASFRVGYQSHSQFSKDYRQYFGRLPKDDVIAHSHNQVSVQAYIPEASI